jgi:voltage-gated potassium channel
LNTAHFDPVKRLRYAIGLIAILIAAGTCGYVALEGYTLVEGLYMTVITLSTVGFTEVRELSPSGRIFTILLIGSGVGTVAYNLSLLTDILLEGTLIKQRRREGRIAKMKDHIIICGYGRIGQRVADRLSRTSAPFVIIEIDPANIARLEESGFSYIAGDAREDGTLERAGIVEARSLVAALRDDSDNVYAILTARSLNSALHIVARAASPGSESKLTLAGADRVISPYEIGSHYIMHAVLKPSVLDFMDFVSEVHADKKKDLEIDEIHIPDRSPLVDTPLQNTHIRSERNVIVLAVKEADGAIVYNPPSTRIIRSGETLICIGFADQLDLLAEEVRGRS